MSSHKALNHSIGDIYTFTKWHDIECMLLDTGEWVANPRGFDPLRGYLHEIDNILITGEIDDIDTLRELRKDLSKIREDFLRFKMEGLYEKEKGGEQ